MHRSRFGRALLLLLPLAAIQACSSSPATHYYMLKADATSQQIPNSELAVTVGPVYLADYLQRQGVVLRDSDVGYAISDTELWAGQLDNDINIILLKNLETLTGSTQLRPFATVGIKAQPSLRVKIDRLDSDAAGVNRLQGSWQLLSAQGEEQHYESFNLTSNSDTATASRITALSALINELSIAIATQLTDH